MVERTELRTAPAPIKAEGRTVQGYAVLYEKPADMGDFYEVVKTGALDGTLSTGRDIRALYHHDDMQLLGTTRAKTLEIGTDSKGLWFALDIPKTSYGNDLLELIKRGDVAGCSFGFIANQDNWVEGDDKPTRELLDVALHEITLTATPAYQDTSLALRTKPKQSKTLSNAKRWLETC